MKAIKRPPKLDVDPFLAVIENHKERFGEYAELGRPVDSKGRYLHYDEFRFRVPKGLDVDLAWGFLKAARERQSSPLITIGTPRKYCNYYLTPAMQKAQSFCDRYASDSALEYMSQKIGEEIQFKHLVNDLIEDEAISSSQLEGAATTTKRAKEMLGHDRKPRTPDERMVLGNFQMMNFAWDKRHEKLTTDLILAMHKVGVDGIDDDKYHPGVLRKDDDVVVEGRDGDILHIPPTYKGLRSRLDQICEWVNCKHDEHEASDYIHPMIKAMTLHFCIGYEHPFRDGNGRVARSLFYWYMFRSGFAAFRYIAISALLKKAPVQYGKSYLFTETDGMDMTYFLDYQSQIVLRSINQFRDVYKQTVKDIEEFDTWAWSHDITGRLNRNQRTIFAIGKSRGIAFTARLVEERMGVSYGTAASALKGLEALGLFTSVQDGRNKVYFLRDKRELINGWSPPKKTKDDVWS